MRVLHRRCSSYKYKKTKSELYLSCLTHKSSPRLDEPIKAELGCIAYGGSYFIVHILTVKPKLVEHANL